MDSTITKIKCTAFILMLLDHIGCIIVPLFPPVASAEALYIILRIMGRGAFPLYAFLAASGSRTTKNINRYAARFFIFALISTPFYGLAFYGAPLYPDDRNVFWTLFLYMAAAALAKHFGTPRLPWTAAAAALAWAMHTDYGASGIILIYLSGLALGFPCGVSAIPGMLFIFYGVFRLLGAEYLCLLPFAVLPAAIYLLSVRSYGGSSVRAAAPARGYRARKYFFYVLYPVHLFILWLVSLAVSRM